MAKRVIKAPTKYGEWEDTSKIRFRCEKKQEKLWEVQDVLQERRGGKEVLVQWSNWEGPNSWVPLDQNPELAKYLEQNRSNPSSCSLFKGKCDNSDVAALKQVVFDALGEIRRTPDGTMGRQTRVSVKVPFRESEFLLFRKAGVTDEAAGNVDTYITCQQLASVLGHSCTRRGYKTSTETYINKDELIHLSWGYKERKDHDHSSCQRCTWDGEEHARPEMCNSTEACVSGPPWITLTFTRARRNRVTGTIAKRRRISRQ